MLAEGHNTLREDSIRNPCAYDLMHKEFEYPPPEPQRIVAFCGFKGHGKDTAADALVSELDFKKTAIADGLRKTVCTALRVPERYFTDPATKEDIDERTGKPRRFWLQHIGTEGFRTLWPDVWVSWWRGEVLQRKIPRVTVTDLRFPNELAVMREVGALVVRVVNPSKEDSGDRHESEMHQEKFDVDYEILNDGSIEDLHKKILDIVRKEWRLQS